MLLLDALRQALSCLLHRRIRNGLLMILLLHQLPIEVVLLFPDSLDALEVVHVFDRGRAMTLPIFVWRASRRQSLTREVLMHRALMLQVADE